MTIPTPDEIRRFRLARGWSVAKAAGQLPVPVDRVTWWRWERGDFVPKGAMAFVLRALIDQYPDDYEGETGPESYNGSAGEEYADVV